MDMFNTLHWAFDDGRYTVWKSVYPPLNFIFLRLLDFLFDGPSFDTAVAMRSDSSSLIAGLVLLYALVPALVLRTRCWNNFSRASKFFLYFAVVFSFPMLFALERGNLIIFAPLLLALAFSRGGVQRLAFIALLINLKPYFAILLLAYPVQGQWKDMVKCAAISGLIFLVSGLFLDPNFFQFFANLLNFSGASGIFSLREMMAMPSSVSAFSYVLKTPAATALLSAHLNTQWIPGIVIIIESVKWASLAIALFVLVKRRTYIRIEEGLALLIVVISNLGVWVGGYTLILYMPLIPIFMGLRLRAALLALLMLIAMPMDFLPMMHDSLGIKYSFLSNAYLPVDWSLGLGSPFRPVANLLVLWILSFEFMTRTTSFRKDEQHEAIGAPLQGM